MNKIPSKFLTVLLIVGGTVSAVAASSKLKAYARPEPAGESLKMEKTVCVALDSAAKVCQGLTDAAAAGAKFVVEKNGTLVGEWESEVFSVKPPIFRFTAAIWMPTDARN